MQFSVSSRGNQVLIYEGFEYLKFREKNNFITWRCRLNRINHCHSTLKTEDNNIISGSTSHSHNSCPQEAAKKVAWQEMKAEVKGIGVSTRNAMGKVLAELNNDIFIQIPKKSSLERNLRRFKQNVISTHVNANFLIPEKYEEMISYDSGVNDVDRILVIGDRDLLS